MARKHLYTAAFAALIALVSAGWLAAQEQEQRPGICFEVVPLFPEQQKEVCVNFKDTWYYPVRHDDGWVIHVRAVNTSAMSHIFNDGQFLVTTEVYDSVLQSLKSQGLAERCLHPEMRPAEDFLTPREEYCKGD